MEMSQRIHLWYKILLEMTIFLKKLQKSTFLVKKKILDSLQKTILS